MILTFKAKKMIDRVIREGKGNLLDDDTRAKIMALDGEPANTYNWASIVHGDDVALISKTDSHPETYVAVCDCD